MTLLANLDTTVRQTLRYLTIALFALLGFLLLANVFVRLMGDLTQSLQQAGMSGLADMLRAMMPITSFHWLDEIVELCFSALIFYGAAALWAEKGHFSVGDWISGHLPGEGYRSTYRMLIAVINLVFLLIFLGFSLRLTIQSTELSTVFQIPKQVMYSSLPISSMIMTAYSLAELVDCIGSFRKKPTG